jgi:nitrite reductase (NADH) large subunit
MLVCHCHRVTDRDIRAHIRGGSNTPAQVARTCRAGTCCGGCMPLISQIVREAVAEEIQQESGTTHLRLAGGARIYR